MADLRGQTPHPADDATTLEATADLLGQTSTKQSDALARLSGVLTRSEFQGDVQPSQPGLLDRALNSLAQAVIDPLLAKLFWLLDRFDLLVSLVGLLLLVWLGVWAWRSLRRTVGSGEVSLGSAVNVQESGQP